MRGVRGSIASALVLASLAGACSLPSLEEASERPLDLTTFLYASDGSLITTLHATEDRVVLDWVQLPRSLRDAVVAIEDRRFWFHHGIDVEAIGRAALVNLSEGDVVEGGSTITQQLVKNLYLDDAETFSRKLDEAALAWQLEDRLTKRQILTKYLNTVYFGQGAYGAQAAAKTYFGVDAQDLTLAQSAMLAGLITAPNHFDPYARMRSALGRRNVVLRLMRQQRMIDRERLKAAARELIALRRGEVVKRHAYPHFVDHVKRWFLGNPAFGETREDRYRALFTGGLRITTSLDPDVQAAAERAVRTMLPYPGDPDAGVTVIDPRTGYVRAMVGGDQDDYWADRRAGRVNLATAAGGSGRQTGSAFKPFALIAALEHGISSDTLFAAPSTIDISLPDGDVWHVTNAEGGGYGTMSLRSATVDSVNTVYAQLIRQLGPEAVVEVATRLGVRCCPRVSEPHEPLQPFHSAVLGANEANTLEMASAYGTLATGGRRVNPVPVQTVIDPTGEIVWQADPRPTQVLDPQIAAAVDDILQDVVLYGTGAAANLHRPQIGKTGTDDEHHNAWFVGAVPQLVAAVWVGYRQGQIPMVPPRARSTVFGGTIPANIWAALMREATASLPPEPFPTPEIDYVAVGVDSTQQPYCLPNRFTLPADIEILQFISGTEPRETCTTPTSLQDVVVPSVVGFPRARALGVLEAAGFYVRVRSEPSTQPAGTVIYQDPVGGQTATQTSAVTVSLATPIRD